MRSGTCCISALFLLAACGNDGSHDVADAAQPDASAIDASPDGPDLTSDPENCGAVGRVCGCGSTSCQQGTCVSAELVTGQSGPVSIYTDGYGLYWGNDADATVMCRVGGSTTTVLTDRTAVRGFVIATSVPRLYLSRAEFNIIESVDVDGAGTGNYTNQQEPGAADIFTDETRTYWLDDGNGNVRSAPVGATVQSPTTLATIPGAQRMTFADTDQLFVTGSDGVYAVPTTGGAPQPLATGQASPGPIALLDGLLVWANNGDGTDGSASIAFAAADGTGSVATVIDNIAPVADIMSIGGGFVWTEPSSGRVMLAEISSTAPYTFTTRPLALGEASPQRLTQDATVGCAYWTDNADGTVGTGSIHATSYGAALL